MLLLQDFCNGLKGKWQLKKNIKERIIAAVDARVRIESAEKSWAKHAVDEDDLEAFLNNLVITAATADGCAYRVSIEACRRVRIYPVLKKHLKRGALGGGGVGAAAGAYVGSVLGLFIPIPIVGVAVGAAVGGAIGKRVGANAGAI